MVAYVLDLSIDKGQSFVGVITDAVKIQKTQWFADPKKPLETSYTGENPPKGWVEYWAIEITRVSKYETVMTVHFKDKDSRDGIYNILKDQIYDQASERHYLHHLMNVR